MKYNFKHFFIYAISGREYTGAAEGDPPHAWNAVNVAGSWRLLDCTFGAGKTNPDGLEFQKQLNEHFFLTDPDEFIFTHFPSDEVKLLSVKQE